MATIKSYTDIEQSRKLVKILPIESADMYYPIEGASPKFGVAISILHIPCWSLAALLSVLPYPSLHKTFSGWRCDSYNKEGTTCKLGESLDNPVDACYKMILKLHELNLL